MFWKFVGHSKADIANAWRDWQVSDPHFGRVEGDESLQRGIRLPDIGLSGTGSSSQRGHIGLQNNTYRQLLRFSNHPSKVSYSTSGSTGLAM